MSRPIIPSSPGELAGGFGKFLRFFFRHKILWIPTISLVFVGCAANACSTYVPPNQMAVSQKYYGSGAGISKEIFMPGLHFVIPGVQKLYMFPSDMQVLNFSDTPSEGSKGMRSAPAIAIQTSDGYKVTLDVTVLYRIEDPYKVFLEAGPGRSFESRLVLPSSDRILRQTLGELNSEELYRGPLRIEKSELAEEKLSEALAGAGIVIEGVLIRRYVYDEAYQNKIEKKKIADQTVFLRQAEQKSTIQQGLRDKIIAEGAAQVNLELARGEAEVKKLQAEADLIVRKRSAEGQLLVELAEAEGTRLENEALQGAGSENMVGLKLAETLEGVQVLVLTSDGENGLNPLDLPSVLKKFEVTQ